MIRSAIFSTCRTWRYVLVRIWDASLPLLNPISLNPSTADELTDDPTVRRWIGYAKRWGFGGVVLTNVAAWRATDPFRMLGAMRDGVDVIGPDNDVWIRTMARLAVRSDGQVILGWGVHAEVLGRARTVPAMLRFLGLELHCLGLTKDGYPKHPLYLPRSVRREPYDVDVDAIGRAA